MSACCVGHCMRSSISVGTRYPKRSNAVGEKTCPCLQSCVSSVFAKQHRMALIGTILLSTSMVLSAIAHGGPKILGVQLLLVGLFVAGVGVLLKAVYDKSSELWVECRATRVPSRRRPSSLDSDSFSSISGQSRQPWKGSKWSVDDNSKSLADSDAGSRLGDMMGYQQGEVKVDLGSGRDKCGSSEGTSQTISVLEGHKGVKGYRDHKEKEAGYGGDKEKEAMVASHFYGKRESVGSSAGSSQTYSFVENQDGFQGYRHHKEKEAESEDDKCESFGIADESQTMSDVQAQKGFAGYQPYSDKPSISETPF
eukprot:GHVQ01002491.1.p1 GENE.GHVQ01002491.1~~GHVQ01002491.1.p1  ORF type:complete len:325 (+),score=31.58 GHVQ01002491.1:46-975(+)